MTLSQFYQEGLTSKRRKYNIILGSTIIVGEVYIFKGYELYSQLINNNYDKIPIDFLHQGSFTTWGIGTVIGLLLMMKVKKEVRNLEHLLDNSLAIESSPSGS